MTSEDQRIADLMAQVAAKTPNPVAALPLDIPVPDGPVGITGETGTPGDPGVLATEVKVELLVPVEVPTGPIMVHYWDIVNVDFILGSSVDPTTQNIGLLKGRVSDADLVAAEIDVAWQVKCGNLVDAGYRAS